MMGLLGVRVEARVVGAVLALLGAVGGPHPVGASPGASLQGLKL